MARRRSWAALIRSGASRAGTAARDDALHGLAQGRAAARAVDQGVSRLAGAARSARQAPAQLHRRDWPRQFQQLADGETASRRRRRVGGGLRRSVLLGTRRAMNLALTQRIPLRVLPNRLHRPISRLTCRRAMPAASHTERAQRHRPTALSRRRGAAAAPGTRQRVLAIVQLVLHARVVRQALRRLPQPLFVHRLWGDATTTPRRALLCAASTILIANTRRCCGARARAPIEPSRRWCT